MKIKKALSLLLSVASLNLSANFINCFSMGPDDYSVTEVAVPGFTNCPNCGAQRSSKISTSKHNYASSCPGCGSFARSRLGGKTGKKYTIYKSTNSILSCRYCGCRRLQNNGFGRHNIKKMYKCANCFRNGYLNYISQKTNNQIWKVGFCKDCNKLDGFVSGKLISGNWDIHTNKRVKKEDKIKGILSDPNGFDYYCYNCQKVNHITLTKEQAERVCTEYDRCLSLELLSSFRSMDMFLDFLPK